MPAWRAGSPLHGGGSAAGFPGCPDKRADFGALVRGKYVERRQTRSNVVVIDPEVAGPFPNAAAVNAALRSLAEIAGRGLPAGLIRVSVSGTGYSTP